ncbi:transporter substrate-binding domain-containing protein [Lihuaxuella thermophila]|uniref:Cystine transport system substrate-binding protein n=1 Tax=Lihuaxuella thermophila TaxID=1173111 RepID=A0A1H8FWY4_9BACL|nr:transporter substrate-binding domain-containing protein [Lihuaxuella thermophila]SEN36202.1 cystine transport system substrate-binding protein [Lihuaxuella thermophila]
MLRKRSGMISIALGLALFLFVSGCSVNQQGDLLSTIKDRGTIRIGTEGTYKPFSFHDEKTNELTGFDVEVAKEVAKRMGVKAEFVEIPWDGMLTSLQTKKIDMVANQVGIKPERKEKFDFSSPYTVSYAQIVVHKDNQEIKGIEQVKGKRAGQTPTSNYGKMAKDAGATIVAYEDMMSAMKDVAAKRIDFSMNDRLAIAEMLKTTKLPLKTVGEPMEKSESAFPVPKGNPELVKEINKALESMKKDGTLAKISQKWFGQDVSK